MKKLCLLLLMAIAFSAAKSQIKVDAGYTILYKDIDEKKYPDPSAFLYANPFGMVVRENATGRTCSPASIECTFTISGQVFRTRDLGEMKKYIERTKPGDKITIEKIVFPEGCFTPPKQVVVPVR
jgi:hypothetical protein